MDSLYYSGFNGFKQVPHLSALHLSTLVQQQQNMDCAGVRDVAVCWNYLVVVDDVGVVTKFGLVRGRNGQERLEDLPKAAGKVVQLSATPRHIMVCTDKGECWAHEESKGWMKVSVGAELEATRRKSADACNSPTSPTSKGDATEETKDDNMPSSSICLLKTSCGDAHNLGLDSRGVAYNLPSPLDFSAFPGNVSHRVTDVVCGKEHCLLLTEHGQVFSWGGGSRGQLGHGALNSEERPRLVQALDGMKIRRIAAGGWHSAVISQFDDLYMFGWNESGQLAQTTNLAGKPAECFATVEKLLMACCTMQPEDLAFPRGGDPEDDCEVYHKDENAAAAAGSASASSGATSSTGRDLNCTSLNTDEIEKEALTCYNAATACNDNSSADLLVVQALPMLVQLPGDVKAVDVACGSRHTVVLSSGWQLWSFGWNKYGQLGLGHTLSRDAAEKMPVPKGAVAKNNRVKLLRCGDWGTALVTTTSSREDKKVTDK